MGHLGCDGSGRGTGGAHRPSSIGTLFLWRFFSSLAKVYLILLCSVYSPKELHFGLEEDITLVELVRFFVTTEGLK